VDAQLAAVRRATMSKTDLKAAHVTDRCAPAFHGPLVSVVTGVGRGWVVCRGTLLPGLECCCACPTPLHRLIIPTKVAR
jgi:hypothetical protein